MNACSAMVEMSKEIRISVKKKYDFGSFSDVTTLAIEECCCIFNFVLSFLSFYLQTILHFLIDIK